MVKEVFPNLEFGRRVFSASLYKALDQAPLNPTDKMDCYPDYLDEVLHHNLLEKIKTAFHKSRKNTEPQRKRNPDASSLNLVEKNCVLYETFKKEHQQFLQSLEKKEEWEEKITEMEQRINDVQLTLSESRNESSFEARERKNKLEKSLRKKTSLSLQLEEITKSLLLRTDTNYLENDKAGDILLQ